MTVFREANLSDPIFDKIKVTEYSNNIPDDLYTLEEQEYEAIFKGLQIEELRNHLANIQNSFKFSNKLTYCIFGVVIAWLAVVLSIVIWQGQIKPLSDGVLIALLSSTTINMISLLILAVKYVFKHGHDNTIRVSEHLKKTKQVASVKRSETEETQT